MLSLHENPIMMLHCGKVSGLSLFVCVCLGGCHKFASMQIVISIEW